jgi:prepilin-type N-terminal cleavage/methylation domain-containing protein
MTAQDQPHPEHGFTLIEALVVLTIAAFAFAMAPLAISLGQKSLSVAGELERRVSTQRALHAITDRIASARPIFETRADGLAALAFDGTSDRVQFITEFAEGPAGGGLYRADLALDSGSSRITLTLTPYINGNTSRATPTAIPLEPASGLTFRYFGPDPNTGASEWQSEWQNATRLPELIEMNLGTTAPVTQMPPTIIALRLSR